MVVVSAPFGGIVIGKSIINGHNLLVASFWKWKIITHGKHLPNHIFGLNKMSVWDNGILTKTIGRKAKK
jgi:hypothetical protein